jgi:hypothetical protein
MAFLRSACGFVTGFALAAVIAFVVFGAGHRAAGVADENPAESLAVAFYLLGVTSIPSAAGFAAVTSPSKRWRELPARRALSIAAAGGFVCYAALLTGIAGISAVVAPFPLGAIGAAIRLVVPGALLGLLAVGAAFTLGPRRESIDGG